MTRIIVLLLVLLGLAGALWWFQRPTEDAAMTTLAAERDFAVKNTDQIQKIFLADRSGETTTLERDGADRWKYNGQYAVRPNAIDNLLDAIRRIEMKYKPPQASKDYIVKNLATHGIKVEIYDRGNKLIKAYYIGDGTQDERGTYAIVDGFNEPFVVNIPGWEGNLRFRYSLKGEDWRDKTVFRSGLREIAEVSIEYPKQKNLSFKLTQSNGQYEVKPFYESTPALQKPVQKSRAETFLIGFENLVAENFERNNLYRDSVKQLVPFSIITLKKTDGNVTSVRLFPINQFDQVDDANLNDPQIERYLADVSTGDFMLVQDRVFRKVLWAYEFFFD